MKHSWKIVTMGLLIAMDIVLTRHLSIQTPIVRLSFGFIAVALMAMLYGPIFAGVGAAVADLIGVTLFPPPVGSFFPGFTLTSFLVGVIYGLFLYLPNKERTELNSPPYRPVKFWRICVAAVLSVGVSFVLNTLWLSIILDRGFIAMLPGRIAGSLIMLPIQTATIRFITGERFRLVFREIFLNNRP